MGLFKRCRAKRAAKRMLKEQAREVKHEEEVILKEEKVVAKKSEPLKQEAPKKQEDLKKEAPKNPEPLKKDVELEVEKTAKPQEKLSVEATEVEEEHDDKTPRETKARYHVTQNKNKNNPNYKRWGVKLSSSSKTIKFHDTQVEAIKHAEHLAKANDTTVVIHKLDGKIRKQNY